MIGFDWDVVRALRLNKPGRSEGVSSPLDTQRMDRQGSWIDGDSGPGLSGRHPGPRRRRAYVERPSRRERDYYRKGWS